MFAMPFNLFTRRRVENQTNGKLIEYIRNRIMTRYGETTNLVVLPHLVCDIITMLELVDESVTSIVNKETTDTPQCLGREELDLRRVSMMCKIYVLSKLAFALISLGSTRPVGWT